MSSHDGGTKKNNEPRSIPYSHTDEKDSRNMNKFIKAARDNLDKHQEKLWRLAGIASYRIEVSEVTGIYTNRHPAEIVIPAELRDNIGGILMTNLPKHPSNLQMHQNKTVLNKEVALMILISFKSGGFIPDQYAGITAFIPEILKKLDIHEMESFLRESSKISAFMRVKKPQKFTSEPNLAALISLIQCIAIGIHGVLKTNEKLRIVTTILLNTYEVQCDAKPHVLKLKDLEEEHQQQNMSDLMENMSIHEELAEESLPGFVEPHNVSVIVENYEEQNKKDKDVAIEPGNDNTVEDKSDCATANVQKLTRKPKKKKSYSKTEPATPLNDVTSEPGNGDTVRDESDCVPSDVQKTTREPKSKGSNSKEQSAPQQKGTRMLPQRKAKKTYKK